MSPDSLPKGSISVCMRVYLYHSDLQLLAAMSSARFAYIKALPLLVTSFANFNLVTQSLFLIKQVLLLTCLHMSYQTHVVPFFLSEHKRLYICQVPKRTKKHQRNSPYDFYMKYLYSCDSCEKQSKI